MTRLFSMAVAVGFSLCAFASTAWCKNYVYKGTVAIADVFTGETQKIPTYLVIGEPINFGVRDDYQLVKSTFVIVDPKLVGKKRFIRQPSSTYRSLRRTVASGGKSRTTVVLTFSEGDETTVSLDGGHSVRTALLSGLVSDVRYAMPQKLDGTALRSIGQTQGTDDSSGVASTEVWKFKLVRDVTDPIPSGETLAESVDRVAEFLMSKGFLEFAP